MKLVTVFPVLRSLVQTWRSFLKYFAQTHDCMIAAFRNSVCHISATEVPEIVQLVFYMELLAISSISEVKSEQKVCFGLPYAMQRIFEQQKNHP